MVKRFTDTELWDEDWFIEMEKDDQLFWIFLKDACDHAGIWRPNIGKFKKLFNCNVDLNKFLNLINKDKKRIEVLKNGRWLLTGFIPFQCGVSLNLANRMHNSVYKLLVNNEVNLTSIRPQLEVIDGLKDKDIDKDKDKDKKKGKGNTHHKGKGSINNKDSNKDLSNDSKKVNTVTVLKDSKKFVVPTFDEVNKYLTEIGSWSIDPGYFIDYYKARDWKHKSGQKMASWKSTINNWKRKENQKNEGERSGANKRVDGGTGKQPPHQRRPEDEGNPILPGF